MLEHKRAGQNQKSGREVAECASDAGAGRKHGKADLRYWKEAIFFPTYPLNGKRVPCRDYSVRIMHKGRRKVFALGTRNETTAAGKAKEIHNFLTAAGWDAALAKYKENGVYKPVPTTVGEFIDAVVPNAKARPKTVAGYCKSFRTIVSDICGIGAGKDKYDYCNGGQKAWLAKVHAVKLSKITPEKVKQWKVDFIGRAAGNPLKEKAAKISANTTIRQAKCLFTPAMLENVALTLPDGLPFDGVKYESRQGMKYKSSFDVTKIIQLALEGDEKKQLAPLPVEQQKIFLLAVMSGMRRNEIDKLEWSSFLWDEGVIRIQCTNYLQLKSEDSADDVDIDAEVMELFRKFHESAKGKYVIESDVEPRVWVSYNHYRCSADFDKLVAWLRANGVSSNKPLHTMRKEFGSQLNAKFGIYAASRALRHGDIAITAEHYLDVRKRVTVGLHELLPNGKSAAKSGQTVGKVAATVQVEPKRTAEDVELVPPPNGNRKPGFFRGRGGKLPKRKQA